MSKGCLVRIDYWARRTRFRRRLKPARPNVWRLSILIRLTWPSTTPRAPGEGQAGGDGVTVAVDARGEGVKAGEVVLSHGGEPVRQALALALGEHGCEGPDVSGECVDFGAVGPDVLQVELFGLGEVFRSAEDPSGTARGVQRLGSRLGTTPEAACIYRILWGRAVSAAFFGDEEVTDLTVSESSRRGNCLRALQAVPRA